MYIYIYIERERERERHALYICVCIYIYIYIYIYICDLVLPHAGQAPDVAEELEAREHLRHRREPRLGASKVNIYFCEYGLKGILK